MPDTFSAIRANWGCCVLCNEPLLCLGPAPRPDGLSELVCGKAACSSVFLSANTSHLFMFLGTAVLWFSFMIEAESYCFMPNGCILSWRPFVGSVDCHCADPTFLCTFVLHLPCSDPCHVLACALCRPSRNLLAFSIPYFPCASNPCNL